MKRITALVMAILMILALTACTKSAEPTGVPDDRYDPEPGTSGTVLSGGWSYYLNPAVDLPEAVRTAFDKVTEDAVYTGGWYVPIAYLGSQVVAGTNYAILCEVCSNDYETGEECVTALEVMVIYQDLAGNLEITGTYPVALTDLTEGEGKTPETLMGGWSVAEETTTIALPDEAQAAFTGSTSEKNPTLAPMALLGTQVVAGTNYAILCRGRAETADGGMDVLQVATVYADLEGNAEITNLHTFDIADTYEMIDE